MRIAIYAHSLSSCWNHGNAHFLRGVMRALVRSGHGAVAYAPAFGWSRSNLIAAHGEDAAARLSSAMPELREVLYTTMDEALAGLDGADAVLVHEWTEPALVAAIGRARARGGRFRLLFHDTHHRAVSDPGAIGAFDLSAYDGVLAFGAALAEVYRARGWGRRAFVWHEAADTLSFRPPLQPAPRTRLSFVGNWGDEERSAELAQFLLAPSAAAEWPADIWGVRYPPRALSALKAAGARYHGWLPNLDAPRVYAETAAAVHVPRRFYAQALPGIPTIRVFESLACGAPLVCAPWDDAEGLFRPGTDYLIARDTAEMTAHLRALRHDGALRSALSRAGAATIAVRHTCSHRADELIAILARLGAPAEAAA